jgi:hypothetical protein
MSTFNAAVVVRMFAAQQQQIGRSVTVSRWRKSTAARKPRSVKGQKVEIRDIRYSE